MDNNFFKILSIDGGGIRGIFPITLLADIEDMLKGTGSESWQIYKNFDLICGTSTGGIIAIALSLGIPAAEIRDLYLSHADTIFGHQRNYIRQLYQSAYDRKGLENLLKETFLKYCGGKQPLLNDCRTNLCIPIYDMLSSKMVVCRNHESGKNSNYNDVPAYQIALATSAAPTYFDPYYGKYSDSDGVSRFINCMIDGSVVANNPAMIGLVEAQSGFGRKLSDVKLLSIGTGVHVFNEEMPSSEIELRLWLLKNLKLHLLENFSQGLSQSVESLVRQLCYGLGDSNMDNPAFVYRRVNFELDSENVVMMDETDKEKLGLLKSMGHAAFKLNASDIMKNFF